MALTDVLAQKVSIVIAPATIHVQDSPLQAKVAIGNHPAGFL